MQCGFLSVQCGFLGSGLLVVVRFFVQMGIHSIKFRDHHLQASGYEPGAAAPPPSYCHPCLTIFRLVLLSLPFHIVAVTHSGPCLNSHPFVDIENLHTPLKSF